ncbi:MAG: peptidase [Curvibacter sp.]|uniref:LexA family protein n=1 Tax=Rhodoferax sp. TS-BS-61-7 TaxID=2094194 RepID=UPI000CF6DF36|nr:translesion error-prone DNA polymerase V autoproteolytic subunit [Rhodoferax sp. TS-BS-61-7]PQA79210.1 peptidase [Rhodoferax sp. TS-BS-61-7]TAH13906.1 MAG: peptidase [Curvibacter sp.]
MYSNWQSLTPLPATVSSLLVRFMVNKVTAGFPSPAEDLGAERLDLSALLVPNPQATFFMRASGVSMVNLGISDQDILVVNKSKRPRHGQIVVASIDGEFTVKKLFKKAGRTKLVAGNPTYPDIVLKEEQILQIWGVVTSVIKVLPA